MTIEAVTINSPATSAAANPFDVDHLTVDDNDATRFLFDLSFLPCYPGGPKASRPAPGNPAEGATIYNMAARGGGNGSVLLSPETSSEIVFANQGFDLTNTESGLSNGSNGVSMPAAETVADIWGAAPAGAAEVGETQHFLWFGYYTMPQSADWFSGGAGLTPIFGANNESYATGAELVVVSMVNNNPGQISARRQTAVGSVESSSLIVDIDAADFGNVVLVAYWRNADGSRLMVKSENAETVSDPAVGADNVASFAAVTHVWGNTVPFNVGPDGYDGLHIHRGGLVNLARSGADPLALMRADFNEQVARRALGSGFL